MEKISGVYLLWFEASQQPYIGCSQDVHSRYREHLYLLKNNKATNYKLQNQYNLYGSPELVILEKGATDKLYDLETAWTKEFDSINNGLNIVEPGIVGYGANSNSSKYTKILVLKVFSLLAKTNLSMTQISSKLNVPKHLVQDIKGGRTHIWLQGEYPELYRKMITRYSGPKPKAFKVLSPDNELIEITDVKAFVTRYYPDQLKSLDIGLCKLRSGSRKQYKGWTLAF